MEDICYICMEDLPQFSHEFVRMTCCGKGMHYKCRDQLQATESLSQEQKNQCAMCRQKVPENAKEQVEYIRKHVEDGKSWSQEVLGGMYSRGLGVKQNHKMAAKLYY